MSESIRSTSPQRPAEVIGEWPDAGAVGVARAVEGGRGAAADWSRAGASVRSRALRDAAARVAAAATELTDLMVREVGKPVTEAAGEVARTVAILEFYAQAAFDPEGEVLPSSIPGSLLTTNRRPRGLVGLVTPWNFPLAIPAWKLAPALAWGNAVVLKPAPDATAGALRLAEILDLPEDVLQVVPGGSATGQALVEHEGIDAISFTGSAAVGREVAVAGARRGIPVQAEMGGHNPCVVMADADVEAAATAIAASAMGYAGQKCTAARRVVTVGEVPGFRDALVEQVERLAVGDPAEARTTVGPLITETARSRVAAAVEQARSGGARVITGGSTSGSDGWYYSPTLVEGVAGSDELAREEVFGPVCTLSVAADVEEAIRFANDTRYGLVAAVFTRSLDTALAMWNRLEAGLVRVNAPTTGVDFYAPFGGEKDSSAGPREQGRAAREFYTSTTTVTIAPAGA